jgi:hypothetical protein
MTRVTRRETFSLISMGACEYRLEGHEAKKGKKRHVNRPLVEGPQEKRPLGRLRRRLVDNMKMDVGDIMSVRN